MSFSVGIVGLPNVGKSTLFKAITKKQVEASNYPFTTINPNVGVVAVPDHRLDALAKMSASAKIVTTTIEFVDIAGLVKGAHKGEGLGNAFLSNIREVDAIVHVVRAFEDSNVIHVAGAVNPAADKETIELELILADLETVSKSLKNVAPNARFGDKEQTFLQATLEKIKAGLEQEKLGRVLDLTDEQLLAVKSLNLLTLKPILTVFNVSEAEAAGSADRLAISAKIESEIAELEPADAAVYLKELGLKQSGLDRLIDASYKLLNLITFLTTGEKESRAWTIVSGTKAPQAAGVIHTDFEAGFIRAEVVNWQELLSAGSWADARPKGILRMEGKDYTMQDGDVVVFHFN